jgi:hypothetical protein
LGSDDRYRLAARSGECCSEGVVVPGKNKTQNRDGYGPRRYQRDRDVQKALEMVGIVDSGGYLERFRDINKKRVKKPDCEGDVERKVSNDQRGDRVQQMERAEDE